MYTTQYYTDTTQHYITLHVYYTILHRHYTTLHDTTRHNVTCILHNITDTTQHYITLHVYYTILHRHYTILHDTTRHYITVYYTTLYTYKYTTQTIHIHIHIYDTVSNTSPVCTHCTKLYKTFFHKKLTSAESLSHCRCSSEVCVSWCSRSCSDISS